MCKTQGKRDYAQLEHLLCSQKNFLLAIASDPVIKSGSLCLYEYLPYVLSLWHRIKTWNIFSGPLLHMGHKKLQG